MLILIVMDGFCAISTVATTVYLFGKRNSQQRPLFVTAQMVLLNLFWMVYLAYFAIMTKREIEEDEITNYEAVFTEESFLAASFAATGDFVFLLHDWLFTEQYLAASLLMPIAVNVANEAQEALDLQRKRAKQVIVYLNVVFYTLTLAWYGLCIWNGSVLSRLANNVIFAAVILVVSYALIRLKRLISTTNVSS